MRTIEIREDKDARVPWQVEMYDDIEGLIGTFDSETPVTYRHKDDVWAVIGCEPFRVLWAPVLIVNGKTMEVED